MSRNTRILLFVLFSLAWAVAMAGVAIRGWPRIPLDMSASDPQTQGMFAQAVAKHITRHLVLAILPPLVILALAWRWIRGT